MSAENTKQKYQSVNIINNPNYIPKKSIHDLVEETCPKMDDGSYDVSKFDFIKAAKELGLKRVGVS